MRRELIYCPTSDGRNVGAIIIVTPEWTSDDYGAVQRAFVAAFGRKQHAHPYANMITLWDDDRTSNGVYYDWGLAGAGGASFTVIRLPSNTLCDLRAAVREIRRQRDVVSLHKLTIHRLVDWNPAPFTAHLPDDCEETIGRKLYAKGYRYKCNPTSRKFDPLYVKTLTEIGPLLRTYPEERFDVHEINERGETLHRADPLLCR